MEKYTKAQMEVIEFENEDVITTSGCTIEGYGPGFGSNDPKYPVKVFDLLQQTGRFGGLPYPIFFALQRALT